LSAILLVLAAIHCDTDKEASNIPGWTKDICL